ncbi:MAG: formate dehydrogenase accessory sulfurtransferase FdhD [bacterium]|nr:formate dehydrogenase accessory sulfurtransferase FdhD [bacterium]
MKTVISVPITKITREGRRKEIDPVVAEIPLTIMLGEKQLVTLLCTPEFLEEMVVGFLVSEGFLKDRGKLKGITIDEDKGIAAVEIKDVPPLTESLFSKRTISSGCGQGTIFYYPLDALACDKVSSEVKINRDIIAKWMSELKERSILYQSTGGAHTCALCHSKEGIVILTEDIGRHNALDKIIGYAFLNNIPFEDKVVITSGRISSEILLKAAKQGLPVIISRGAPTNLAVEIAGKLGITVIGFARGRRMNVYSHSERVVG